MHPVGEYLHGRCFASDNASGIHPKVLDAIAEANRAHASAYGDDPWTHAARSALAAAFDSDIEALFCFGGTGANVISLATLVAPYESVLCAQTAHVWNDECSAPERFTNAKLIPLRDEFGKISVDDVIPHLGPGRGVHRARPRVISITQPTEWGTVYSLDELHNLASFAHEHEMMLHVDGARLANAAVTLNASLADIARCGIDALSFGGTKNGLMGAEAVILFRPELATRAAYARKQATQLASKMRFIAAQFLAYLEGDLWRSLAAHANDMAASLARQCQKRTDIQFVAPVSCNLLFPRLSATALEDLQRDFYFYTWSEPDSIARWITSFDTTAEDVEVFSGAVARALSHKS